jgi:hypothetical protein
VTISGLLKDGYDLGMAKQDHPMQKTPKGYEIPIPTRDEVDRVFKKVTKAAKPKSAPRRPKK